MKKPLPCIGILRWIASVSVLFWHYQHFYTYDNKSLVLVDKDLQPLYQLFSFFYNSTFNPVGIFWLISGVLISNSYLNQTGKPLQFLRQRLVRLYPLAFITVFLMLVLQILASDLLGMQIIYTDNTKSNFLLNLLMINSGESFNGPLYSLTLEIPIYFSFAFIFLKISSAKFLISKTFFSFIICFALFSFFATTIFEIKLNLVFLCGMHFYAGVFLHVISQKINPLIIQIIAFILFVVNIVMQLESIKSFAIVAVVYSFDIMGFCDCRKLNKISIYLSNLCYASYLLHIPIQLGYILLINSFFDMNNIANSIWFFTVYFSSVVFGSYVTDKYIDSRIRRILSTKFI